MMSAEQDRGQVPLPSGTDQPSSHMRVGHNLFGTRLRAGGTVPDAELLSTLQLAHELRSPLASIQSALDMLLQGSGVVERVMVASLSGLVDLDTTTTSLALRDEFMADLPVPGRFYQSVTTLAPGCADPGGQARTVHASRSREFRAVVNGVSSAGL